ncbi:MAG: sugar phosphate isomerase/epimerase [Deinococcota bacterium]
MLTSLSCISANYVAREVGYQMTEGWMQGDAATQAAFRPISSFADKFDELLTDVAALGFTAIDLWGGHLHPDWASAEHIEIAKDLLAKHKLEVISLATWIGSKDNLEHAAKLANDLGASSIGGGCPELATFRTEAAAILKNYDVKLGLENHPETHPDDMLAQIDGGADGYIGTALDTGWWATQGFSAAQAIHDLKDHLVHVHLKDVQAVGAHDTCQLGKGVADIPACLQALQDIGYTGVLAIEHEPETFDPTDDLRASRVYVEDWMNQHG